MDNTAQWARDRAEIESLAHCYAKGNDIDAGYFDLCLDEEVEVEYDFGTWRGLGKHKEVRDATIPIAFSFTQHIISNPSIEIKDDAAEAEYYVFAVHGMRRSDGSQAVVYAGATYYQRAVRTPKGWRVKHHRCTTNWVDDEGGLMRAVGISYAEIAPEFPASGDGAEQLQ